MKKKQELRLPKISADQIATNLKRGVGEDKAIKIAGHLSKELKGIETGDVNDAFFSMKTIKKDQRIWEQVHNILQKQAR